jgi:hypothetical protein
MQALPAMVVYGGAQIFKVAPRCRVGADVLGVVAAQPAVDVGEGLAAEEVDEPVKTVRRIVRPRVLRHHVLRVQGDDVRDKDFVRLTHPAVRNAGAVLLCEVLR